MSLNHSNLRSLLLMLLMLLMRLMRFMRLLSLPQRLLKYPGAHVNRVAISPQRILAYDPSARTVTHRWSTNAESNQRRELK